MTITTHATVGAAIGFHIGNPILGFFLGLASHFLLDMIPHGDSKISDAFRIQKKRTWPITYTALDAIIAVYLILFIFNLKQHFDELTLSLSIAGAVLPDLIVGAYDVTKSKYLRWFNNFHFKAHDLFTKKTGDVCLHHALVVQTIFIILLLRFI